MSETRVVRILRALAGAPDGLSTSAIVDAGAEGLTPRLAAIGRYTVKLSQCTAAGEVEIAAKTATTVGHHRRLRPARWSAIIGPIELYVPHMIWPWAGCCCHRSTRCCVAGKVSG